MTDPTTSVPADWCWDPMPAVDGWFAVLRCYDYEEGAFPGVVWANGGKVEWPDNRGMTIDGSCHAGPFPTKAEARNWADAHDPDGPL